MAPVIDNRNPLTKIVETGQLTRRARAMAIAFLAVGLLTFFLPIIAPSSGTGPNVSVWQTAEQLQITMREDSMLPVLPFVPFIFVYLALAVALGAAVLLPFKKAVAWICVAGLFLLIRPFRGFLGAFQLMKFMDSAQRGGGVTPVWIMLAISLIATAIVAWTDADIRSSL